MATYLPPFNYKKFKFEWKDHSYGRLETVKTTSKTSKALKMKDLVKNKSNSSDYEESLTLNSPLRKVKASQSSSTIKGILKNPEI
jgi:hypothetical protein